MKIDETPIEGCYIITPKIFSDDRGYFSVTYNEYEFRNNDNRNFRIVGGSKNFIQDNQSKSQYGVIRGLHYQRIPYRQTKLVRCVFGKILDVIVDLRKDSKTYGKHISIPLDDETMKMVLVPNYCAHGFSTLSNHAIIQYKVDAPYQSEYEECIRWNDSDLAIDWKIPMYTQKLSEKDKRGILWKDIKF